MHFNDYHYIATIAKHQSITKAAEELFISQPYLSKFLNNLEKQYDTSFFNRTSYPITLTFAGERYLEYARRILDLETELKGSMQDIISGSAGTLTIGVPSSAGSFLLPYVLPVFQKRYPKITVSLVEKNSNQLLELVQEGKIDLGVFSRPTYPDDVQYEFIFDEQVLLAAPPGHPLAISAVPSERPKEMKMWEGRPYTVLEEDTLKELDGEPFILMREELSMGIMTRQVLNFYNVTPKIIMVTGAVQTAYRLTAQGMGFSFVSELGLKNVHFKQAPPLFQIGKKGCARTWVAAYKKGSYIPESLGYFMGCLKRVGGEFMGALYNGVYGVDLTSADE